MESHATSHKVTSAPSDIGKEMSPRRHYFGRPGAADDPCHDVSRLAQNIKIKKIVKLKLSIAKWL